MRFLHTADWHLGRIFHGVHLTDDQAYVLEQFITLVKDTRPDAIIIAGDIYDRSVPPTEAVRLLDETLSRLLMDYKVPIIMIAGNHDSPERLGFGSSLMASQGLHVVGSLPLELNPIILYDTYGPVYFAPITYAEPAVVRETWQMAAPDHEAAVAAMIEHVNAKIPSGARRIAVAHAFLAGGSECESERPLSVGGSSMVNAAIFKSFHYTALGHLHNSQKAGGENIRYAGSLLKYSFDEAKQKKGINLVEIDEQGGVKVELVQLSPRRDVRCVTGLFADLEKGVQPGGNPDDYLMVTLDDNEPILDARVRLKAVYPNVLDFAYTRLSRTGTLKGPAADHRKLTEKELFSSFFLQMTGDTLTEKQSAGFVQVVEELYRQQREVKI
ncbi:MAG: exonuclease SbcCD subunit D [Pelosinus sp.]|nr:exonuclease SbcCD subunit D [Pelosinus sp.]